MLVDATLPVPASLRTLLAGLAPLFTAPSFRTFCGLACGFLAQTGKRTVCGMLAGAGLARSWNHDRAHRFFSRARWSPEELGLAVARLVVALLVPAGEPVAVVIDDTLFRRRGKKVWAASWFHDGSAPGPAKTGYGNNWVIAAVVVRLPAVSRPVAIPVLAKLVIKGTSSASRLRLARRMAQMLASVTSLLMLASRTCVHDAPAGCAPASPVPHREHCAGGSAAFRSSGSGSRARPAPGWPGCPPRLRSLQRSRSEESRLFRSALRRSFAPMLSFAVGVPELVLSCASRRSSSAIRSSIRRRSSRSAVSSARSIATSASFASTTARSRASSSRCCPVAAGRPGASDTNADHAQPRLQAQAPRKSCRDCGYQQ
jgi:hypothetical protein